MCQASPSCKLEFTAAEVMKQQHLLSATIYQQFSAIKVSQSSHFLDRFHMPRHAEVYRNNAHVSIAEILPQSEFNRLRHELAQMFKALSTFSKAFLVPLPRKKRNLLIPASPRKLLQLMAKLGRERLNARQM